MAESSSHGVTVVFVPYKGAMMQFKGKLVVGSLNKKHVSFEGNALINEKCEDGLVSSLHLVPCQESFNVPFKGHVTIMPNDPIYIMNRASGSWVVCSDSIPTTLPSQASPTQAAPTKKRAYKSSGVHKKRNAKTVTAPVSRLTAPPKCPPSGGVSGSEVVGILFG